MVCAGKIEIPRDGDRDLVALVLAESGRHITSLLQDFRGSGLPAIERVLRKNDVCASTGFARQRLHTTLNQVLHGREKERTTEALAIVVVDASSDARRAERISAGRIDLNRDMQRRHDSSPQHRRTSLPALRPLGYFAVDSTSTIDQDYATIHAIDGSRYRATHEAQRLAIDGGIERAGDGRSLLNREGRIRDQRGRNFRRRRRNQPR